MRLASVIWGALLLCTQAVGADLRLAVAANFAAPMQLIAEQFEQQSGHKLSVSFGSSGKFFAQITHGAPFDVFFSADQAKPHVLVSQQLALADSSFTYALGALALWSVDKHGVDPNGQVLSGNHFNKLALANSRLAPYGKAAEQVLQKLGLLEATRAKWVQGENIAQTYQFVASQNAQLGFVAQSQIFRQGRLSAGSAWLIPAEYHDPIRQDAVILSYCKDPDAARQLLQFMRSAAITELIKSFGYGVEE